ncbi:hypothetical protein [Thomasclavelia sp.]|uniref:hypothetical protein n=1 Tax=Thomasclavelia sp. TaxID=3025757 RepID=UPI0025E236F4|nr:hypothetical protein [Thomasclavelia sp.]
MLSNTREKINISFNDTNINSKYETIFFTDNSIHANENTIYYKNIKYIEILISSSQGDDGIYTFFLNYYVDLNIYTNDAIGIYKYQIMNNDCVKKMFDFLEHLNIDIIDPLSLKKIYTDYDDPVARNKYINRKFKKWAKNYDLNNPRENYYDSVKDVYTQHNYKNEKASKIIKEEFKLFFKTWKMKIMNLFKK